MFIYIRSYVTYNGHNSFNLMATEMVVVIAIVVGVGQCQSFYRVLSQVGSQVLY
jgi:hypothetical protein